MRMVNQYMISAVLEPFLSLQETEMALWTEMDATMEHEARLRMRNLLVPYFHSFDSKGQEIVRDSLGYLLITGYEGWSDLLSSSGCPIDFSGSERIFFEWLWDELFHKAIGLEGPQSSYTVNNDFHAPNLIKRNI